jgi:Calcium binding
VSRLFLPALPRVPEIGLVFSRGLCFHAGVAKARQNQQREQRIQDEIIVDAYGAEEQAMGWYYYLEEHLHLPFRGKCIGQRATSPLIKGQEMEVMGLAPAEECEHEMFVTVKWDQRRLAVPLAQLEVIQGDKVTKQAVEDWHYWVDQGYEF